MNRWLSTARMKVVTTFYRRLVVFMRWTDPTAPRVPPDPPLRCGILGPRDLDDYRILRGRFRRRRALPEAQSRLARGDHCVGVWDGDALVHAAWVALGPGLAEVPYLRSRIPLDRSDVLVYDTFTTPSRRGEGLAGVRDEWTRSHFAALGHPRTVTLVTPENRAGLRAIEPAGYLAEGVFRLVRLGPFQKMLSRPAW